MSTRTKLSFSQEAVVPYSGKGTSTIIIRVLVQSESRVSWQICKTKEISREDNGASATSPDRLGGYLLSFQERNLITLHFPCSKVPCLSVRSVSNKKNGWIYSKLLLKLLMWNMWPPFVVSSSENKEKKIKSGIFQLLVLVHVISHNNLLSLFYLCSPLLNWRDSFLISCCLAAK